MGLLTITRATLDRDQFEPSGRSDADTFTLDVSNAVFTFLPHTGAASIQTTVFANTKVSGKRCIKNGKLRVRLEGIDAPELSYQPTLDSGKKQPAFSAVRRKDFTDFNELCAQDLAEEARAALLAYLKGAFPSKLIDVEVRTYVGLPGDVFDSNGRFVGDVFVTVGGNSININQWVVEKGWAFPQYYESMRDQDINDMDQAWVQGKNAPGGVWKIFAHTVPPHKPQECYCPATPVQAPAPALTLPKLFRRQLVWWGGSQAGLWNCSFHDYLRNKGEKVMLKEEFLKCGRAARKYEFADFITPNGTLTLDPECFVFPDNDSELTDPNGKFLTPVQIRFLPRA